MIGKIIVHDENGKIKKATLQGVAANGSVVDEVELQLKEKPTKKDTKKG